MSLRVRAAGKEDVALLSRLHDASFDEKWSAQAIETLLSVPGTFALVGGNSKNWQSFVLARVVADEAEILSLATLPTMRRKGLARSLVVTAAEDAAGRGAGKIFLDVSMANAAARALYQGLGFAEVGVRRTYYRHLDGAHADALILAAALPLARQAPL